MFEEMMETIEAFTVVLGVDSDGGATKVPASFFMRINDGGSSFQPYKTTNDKI